MLRVLAIIAANLAALGILAGNAFAEKVYLRCQFQGSQHGGDAFIIDLSTSVAEHSNTGLTQTLPVQITSSAYIMHDNWGGPLFWINRISEDATSRGTTPGSCTKAAGPL